MFQTPKTLSSRLVYGNPWMTVYEDKITHANVTAGTYGYINSTQSSVYVVSVDADGNTYIVNQYRYPIKRTSWEWPAGRINSDEYDPLTTARRELEEETGLYASQLTQLAHLQIANGMTTFDTHLFLAQDLKRKTTELDAEDGIFDCKKVPLTEVIRMIMHEDITCSQSIASYMIVQEDLKGMAI